MTEIDAARTLRTGPDPRLSLLVGAEQGHPLACAAAVATMNALADEGIVENAARMGRALNLVTDRTTREPLAPYGGTSPAMTELGAARTKNGLLPFTNYHRLHVVPPCTVSDDEAREGLAMLDDALTALDAHYTGR